MADLPSFTFKVLKVDKGIQIKVIWETGWSRIFYIDKMPVLDSNATLQFISNYIKNKTRAVMKEEKDKEDFKVDKMALKDLIGRDVKVTLQNNAVFNIELKLKD